MDAVAPRTAGRQRLARHDVAILAATLEILSTVGYDNLTIEAVARRARVGRPTIYRRWSTKASLALAAVARSSGRPPTPNSGNLRSDLGVLQRHQMTLMNSSLFRSIAPALTAHFSADAQLAESYVRDFVDLRRSAVRVVVDRAVARGDLPGDVDVDMIYDVLTGPLFYRAIARGERLDREFVEGIVDVVVGFLPSAGSAPDTSDRNRQFVTTHDVNVGSSSKQ